MIDPKEVMIEAVENGRVWLGGELEFPAGITASEAYYMLVRVAEACGHTVRMVGRSIVNVYPGDSTGYYQLDWYDGDRPGPWRVDAWTCKAAYAVFTREKDGAVKSRLS